MLPWKSNMYYMFWVCVCSLSYPACKAQSPYCHPCPFWLYHIFPHKRHDFRKKVIGHDICVLIFSTTFVWILILRRVQRDTIITGLRSSCKIPVVVVKVSKNTQNTQKYSNIKFHENPFSGNRVVTCGRTDRHDEASSRFSQFCEGA
jgi:hypothetical protein